MIELIGDLKLSKLPIKLSFEVLFEIAKILCVEVKDLINDKSETK
jgi:hypothetical protein